MQQDEELLVDPEEETERKLVHYMALGIVAVIAGGILILVIRPWMESYREQHAGQDGDEALPDNEVAQAA